MANNSAYVKFSGFEAMDATLQALPSTFRAAVLEQACGKAAVPIRRAMKALAPKDTGALRASIVIKTLSDPWKGTAAALIGPSRDFFRGSKRVSRKGDKRGANRPSKYAHLIEYGHAVVAPKKGTQIRKKTAKVIGFVAPRPFIRPAYFAGAAAAETIMMAEIDALLGRTVAAAKRSA